MNAKLLLFLISVFCFGVSWGQHRKLFDSTETRIIKYDFQTGKYEKLNKIRVHTPVVFEISNINPFAYNIVLTPKDSILASSSFDREVLQELVKWEVQKAEQNLNISQNEQNKKIADQVKNIPTGDFKETKHIDSNDKVTPTSPETNKEKFNLTNQVLELQNAIRDGNATIDSLKLYILREGAHLKIESILDNVHIDNVNIQNALNKVQQVSTKDSQNTELTELALKKDALSNALRLLKSTNDNTTQYRKMEADLSDQIDGKFKTYYELADQFYTSHDNFMKDARHIFTLLRYAKIINAVADNPKLSYQLYKERFAIDLKFYREQIYVSIMSIDNYKQSHSELTKAFYKLTSSSLLDEIMEPSGIAKAQLFPQFLWNKADNLKDFLANHPIDIILKESFWMVSMLEDSTNYSIRSAPFQPERDMLEFHVHISKRHKNVQDPFFKERNFHYRQPLYGGTRVDFSLGLAGSYYWDVDSYELDSSLVVSRSPERSITVPSLIGMITMSHRKTGYITYGASAGMGIGVENGKIQLSNFYFGPTMLLGKTDRIFVSAGASLKNIRRLKQSVTEYTKVPPSNDLSSYTKDYYKIGVFVSATYSLTKDAKAMIKNLR